MVALIVGAVVAVVGIGLVVLGAYMSLQDWKQKRQKQVETKEFGFAEDINAFTKLIEAIKDYAPGMQLTILGIVVIIVGGVLMGVGGLA